MVPILITIYKSWSFLRNICFNSLVSWNMRRQEVNLLLHCGGSNGFLSSKTQELKHCMRQVDSCSRIVTKRSVEVNSDMKNLSRSQNLRFLSVVVLFSLSLSYHNGKLSEGSIQLRQEQSSEYRKIRSQGKQILVGHVRTVQGNFGKSLGFLKMRLKLQ